MIREAQSPGLISPFTAPDSGASGSFTGTGSRTTTVKTNLNGIANAPTFAANAEVGSYSVVASAGGVKSVNFTLHNLFWFVATTGSDSNDCRTPSTPCATIGGPVGKVGFFGGDTVLVGSGVYTGSGDQVLLIDKNVNLSGGWDSMFSTQSGFSTIDGQNSRRGIYVNANVTAALDHFTVQNGLATNFGGGIHNEGILRLDYLSIQNNQCLPAVEAGSIRLGRL